MRADVWQNSLSVGDKWYDDQRFVLILCIVVYQMDGIIQYAYCIVIQMYFLINKIFLNNIIWFKFISSCTVHTHDFYKGKWWCQIKLDGRENSISWWIAKYLWVNLNTLKYDFSTHPKFWEVHLSMLIFRL